MSRSRFGGFRAGKKKYLSKWETMKSPSSTVTAPTSAQNFDYSKAQGIWNLNSTIQFPKAVFSGSYITSADVGATSSSYTFNSIIVGDAHVYRKIAVTVSWNAGNTGRLLTSATIGGTSATILQSTAGAGNERSAIIYADLPDETTADITLNFNGNINRGIAIGIFRLINVTEITSAVYDAHNNTTTTYTTNISVVEGDFVISALGTGDGVANWTNTTERYSYRRYLDYLEGASIVAGSTGTLSISATGSKYGVLTTVAFR